MHVNFIDFLYKKNNDTSLREVIEHTVYHETGHAYYSRELEKDGVFPYVFRTSNRSIIRIDGRELRTNKLSKHITYLVNGILDYPIDRFLNTNVGLCDSTAKIRVDNILPLPPGADRNEVLRKKMDVLFNLPTAIHDYEFGKIDREVRTRVKENSISYVGEELWNSTFRLLERLSTNPKALRDVYPKVFEILFNLKVNWRFEKKEVICDFLPTFWDDDEYELLYINS